MQASCGDGTTTTVSIDLIPLGADGAIIQTRPSREEAWQSESGELLSRLNAIVSSSEDAILSKDLDGKIQSWNAAAERLFGYSAEEMIGRSIRTLIPADRQAEEDRVLEALRRGERIEHYETVRVRKDGSTIDISLSVSPVCDGGGRVVGAAKIVRDISFRKQAEQELERSQQLKDEFLSLVSHELRTPVALMAGNSNLLLHRRSNLSPAEEQQAIADLADTAQRMQSMIENLLLLRRMEVGDVIPLEPVQVQRLVEGLARSVATRSGRDVAVDARGDVPPVMAEPGLLTLVFENLLSNAIKYSPPEAPIALSIEVVEATVRVHVLDRGIGLRPEDFPSLLTPFYRSPVAKKRATGLGLGLPVCHRIMQAVGGNMEVAARAGGGSDFSIVLPTIQDLETAAD
jgi:PAS domain S-box-containing protein